MRALLALLVVACTGGGPSDGGSSCEVFSTWDVSVAWPSDCRGALDRVVLRPTLLAPGVTELVADWYGSPVLPITDVSMEVDPNPTCHVGVIVLTNDYETYGLNLFMDGTEVTGFGDYTNASCSTSFELRGRPP